MKDTLKKETGYVKLISLTELFRLVFQLGFLSFGGVESQINSFRNVFTIDNKLITPHHFDELQQICRTLPGAPNTLLLIAISTILTRSAFGGILAFTVFFLPSFIVLAFMGMLIRSIDDDGYNYPKQIKYFLRGFRYAAVAVIWQTGYKLTNDLVKTQKAAILFFVSIGVFCFYRMFEVIIGVMIIGSIIYSMIESEQVAVPQINSPGTSPIAVKKPEESKVIMEAKQADESEQVENNEDEDEDEDKDEDDGDDDKDQKRSEKRQSGKSSSEQRKSGKQQKLNRLEQMELEKQQEFSIELDAGNFHVFGVRSLILLVIIFALLQYYRFMIPHSENQLASLFISFYQIGCFVIGGGHVLIPFVLTEFTGGSHITPNQFWTGYSLVNALPGPVYNISAYIGGCDTGLSGAIVSSLALFTPGFLYIWAVLPLWKNFQKYPKTTIILQGFGIVAVALVWVTFVMLVQDNFEEEILQPIMVFIVTFIMLNVFDVPIPIVIFVGGFLVFIRKFSKIYYRQLPGEEF